MSTIGIVAVSLVIGLFLAVLIGSVIFLVWTCLKLHKAVILTQSEFSGQVQTHADDVRRFQTDTANLLKSHAEAFNQAVSRINGDSVAYNRDDPLLPDILVCRPAIAGLMLDAIQEVTHGN